MENALVLELPESKFRDLYVCFCGYAQCEPLHSYGPFGYEMDLNKLTKEEIKEVKEQIDFIMDAIPGCAWRG